MQAEALLAGTGHPAEARFGASLRALAGLTTPLDAANAKALAGEAYVSWDADQAQIRVQAQASAGEALRLTAKVDGKPRWFNLAFVLADLPFAADEVIGLAIRHHASQPLVLQPLLRARLAGGHRDTALADGLSAGPDPVAQVILHRVAAQEELTNAAASHVLVIPLPEQDFTWTIQAMRLFVQPAGGAGPALGLPSLGDWAI